MRISNCGFRVRKLASSLFVRNPSDQICKFGVKKFAIRNSQFRLNKMTQFAGQVAVITGAASGLGLAIARKLAVEGGRVALLDLNEGALQKAASEVGPNAVSFPIDLTNEDQVASVISQVAKAFGRIDVLVNCAGVTGKTNIKSHEVETGDLRFVLT